jgi:hypothetical protein
MPKQPPMKMWVDDWRAYSMNEIAINWNAPLVFLLAGGECVSLGEGSVAEFGCSAASPWARG